MEESDRSSRGRERERGRGRVCSVGATEHTGIVVLSLQLDPRRFRSARFTVGITVKRREWVMLSSFKAHEMVKL